MCIDESSCSTDLKNFESDVFHFLQDVFFSLHDWVQWFISSQGVGVEDLSISPSSFRWRGRPNDSSRLAPNTLASGLDDYPRSQYPSSDERHVDLMSWIALSTRIMSRLSDTLANSKEYNVALAPDFIAELKATQSKYYSDDIFDGYISNLHSIHWSSEDKTYYDVGLVGTEEKIEVGVMVRCAKSKKSGIFKDTLVRIEFLRKHQGRENAVCPSEFPIYMYPLGDGHGGLQSGNMYSASKPFHVGFIPRVGYVNIFPFILKLLPDDSLQLEHMLDLISSPHHLWSEHGLRSLSKNDLFYQKENAPGDAPYWRGPIWIPINYLTLGALKHYGERDACPHHNRAIKIYQDLRDNVLRTVLTEYYRSGYFWEIYDDSTGKGMRGHPFSGWTTLFVNIMAELF